MVSPSPNIRVLALVPYANPYGVGEAFSSYRLAKELSEHCELTVLAQSPRPSALVEHIPRANVIAWPDVPIFKRLGRLDAMLKPGFAVFARRVRTWLRNAGADKTFDVVHQMAPLALRYTCPVPASPNAIRVMGPLAGSLPTPDTLKQDAKDPILVRLRNLDKFRMRWDAALRSTYRYTDLAIGAAPYVRNLLPNCFTGRFEVMSEVGIDDTLQSPRALDRNTNDGTLRVLFVGRLVGTKGLGLLLDAMHNVKCSSPVQLDIVGDGPLRPHFTSQATQLSNVRVRFHGRLPREEVDIFYQRADVFALPSFREPSGNAVIEAMSWGLPVLVIDYGGPAHAVNNECGIKIPLGPRERMVSQIAEELNALLQSPTRRSELGARALAHIRTLSWRCKATTLCRWYHDILSERRAV